MSADILGTSCDQCRSMVQYSFTSTETGRLVRTDSPGRPPRLSHSSWTMLEEWIQNCIISISMGVHYFCHSVCLFFIFIQCKRYNFLALLPPPNPPTHIVRHLEVLGICGEILTFIIIIMNDCMHTQKISHVKIHNIRIWLVSGIVLIINQMTSYHLLSMGLFLMFCFSCSCCSCSFERTDSPELNLNSTTKMGLK